MGEEYGENAPFLYFVSHGDQHLIDAVRAGRKEEFRAFHSEGAPPDPAGLETYKASTLKWIPTMVDVDGLAEATFQKTGQSPPVQLGNIPAEQVMLHQFYQRLIEVRKQCKISVIAQHPDIVVEHTNDVLYYRRKMQVAGDLLCLMNFGKQPREVELPLGEQTWHQKINSSEPRWCREGSRCSPDTLPAILTEKTTPKVSIPSLSIALYQAQ